MTRSCECHSGKMYEECCKPYHDGTLPENALLLMRSRYSALALNLPSYIVQTTHPASPQYTDNHFSWKRDIASFCKNCRFQNLEILDVKENQNIASVVFTVTLFQDEQEIVFTEKSYFEKFHDRWLYRLGHVVEGKDSSLIEQEPLRVLPLTYIGDAVLRRKGEIIENFSPEILQFIDDMKKTMYAAEGIGLAAPQVGKSLRLFMIRPLIMGKDPFVRSDRISDEVKVFINPVVTSMSQETWNAAEACLSIPAISASVQRPKEIQMSYLDESNTARDQSFIGWEARQILHEYDHIEGVLFPDRLSKKEMEKIFSRLNKLEKRIRN